MSDPAPQPWWRQERLAWSMAAAALAVLLAVCNWPLLHGSATPAWDAGTLYAPWFSLLSDHARAGQLMLWNPWTQGGSPDGAYPDAGALSPLWILSAWALGPTLRGFVMHWLLIWWAAGLGVLLLARHWRAPVWGGLAAACGFVFGGFFTGQAQHIGFINAVVFVPWVIWRLDVALTRRPQCVPVSAATKAALEPSPSGRGQGEGATPGTHHLSPDVNATGRPHPNPLPEGEGIRRIRASCHALRRRWLPAAQAGALWGLSGLCGYPPLVLMTLMLAVAWTLGRVIACGEEDRSAAAPDPLLQRSLHAASIAAILIVVGMFVMSPVYIAYLAEARGYTDRAGHLSREVAVHNNAFHPGAVATLASPHLSTLWERNPDQLWAYTDQSMCSVYIGAPALMLALAGLLARPRDKWRWWLLGVAIVFLMIAMARVFPLRGWMYDLIPITRYFRQSALIRVEAMFLLAALAILGSRDVAAWLAGAEGVPMRRLAVGVAVLGGGAAVAFAWVMAGVADRGEMPGIAYAHVIAMWLVVPVVVLVVVHVGVKARPAWLPRMGPAFVALVLIDGVAAHVMSRHFIWDDTPGAVAAWRTVDAQHVASLDLAENRQARVPRLVVYHPGQLDNKNVIVKVPALLSFTGMTSQLHERWFSHPALMAAACGHSRMWFAPEAARVALEAAAFDKFEAIVRRGAGWPIVVHEPHADPDGPNQILASLAKAPAAINIGYRLDAYVPNALTITVACPSDGWLLVTDRWANGWRASVNGQPVEVMGGNFIFRAVPVKRGENAIRFWYQPAGVPQWLTVSWSVLGSIVALSVVAGIRHRRAASRRV